MSHTVKRQSQATKAACKTVTWFGRIDLLFTFTQPIADSRINKNHLSTSEDQRTRQTHTNTVTGIRWLFFLPQLTGHNAKLCTTVIPPKAGVEKANGNISSSQHKADY